MIDVIFMCQNNRPELGRINIKNRECYSSFDVAGAHERRRQIWKTQDHDHRM